MNSIDLCLVCLFNGYSYIYGHCFHKEFADAVCAVCTSVVRMSRGVGCDKVIDSR